MLKVQTGADNIWHELSNYFFLNFGVLPGTIFLKCYPAYSANQVHLDLHTFLQLFWIFSLQKGLITRISERITVAEKWHYYNCVACCQYSNWTSFAFSLLVCFDIFTLSMYVVRLFSVIFNTAIMSATGPYTLNEFTKWRVDEGGATVLVVGNGCQPENHFWILLLASQNAVFWICVLFLSDEYLCTRFRKLSFTFRVHDFEYFRGLIPKPLISATKGEEHAPPLRGIWWARAIRAVQWFIVFVAQKLDLKHIQLTNEI